MEPQAQGVPPRVQSLFDKYGGVPFVTGVVRDFYKRVLRRPNLRRYFEGVDQERLIHHQVAFVSLAMGKMPSTYVGRNMKDAHAGLGITSTSFDMVVELLCDAMRAAGIEERDVITIATTVSKYKNAIVER